MAKPTGMRTQAFEELPVWQIGRSAIPKSAQGPSSLLPSQHDKYTKVGKGEKMGPSLVLRALLAAALVSPFSVQATLQRDARPSLGENALPPSFGLLGAPSEPEHPAVSSSAIIAMVSPCEPGSTAQQFDYSAMYGGVIGDGNGDMCLCSQPKNASGTLTFDTCEGPGAPLHDLEIGWGWTASTVPAPIAKAGTVLCVESAAGGLAVLAPCAPGASQLWSFSANKTINSAANASLCLTVSSVMELPLLSNVFGNDQVLQRDAPAELWGWTKPAGVVTVTFNGVNYTSAPAGADGRWLVMLPAMPATASGEPGYNISVVDASGSTAWLNRTLFGDVYWCSGQSNLSGGNTPVSYAYNASAEIAAAALYTWVRVFTVGTYGSGSPVPLPQLGYSPRIPWSVASPSSVAGFSATCWFAGRGIADALGSSVPLGLVESAWGGTSIQAWTPPGVVAKCGDYPPYPGGWPTATASLYNAMTVPFTGMKITAIVWYQ